MKSVDILVAVRNEEKSIPLFINQFNVFTPDNVKINIIFLEDGSTDGTVNVLRDLSKKNKNVDYISLENKYGQYAALTLGLIYSKADAVITMDVDGGHPVETAIEMIKTYLRDYNLVQGHRIIYKRKKFYRSILSYMYNLIFYIFVGVNLVKQNVMFRLMDKSAKEKFLQNKKWWHIFKTNFSLNDDVKTAYINYSAPEREIGESKYGLLRLLKLSYKSFFSLLPLMRLLIINLILLSISVLGLYYSFFLISVLCIAALVIIDSSYHFIVNQYPVPLLKIIETSLPEIKE
ncbi:MAG TPA: hypothetical protein DHV28_00920 [Ignavibacteriales bacterium]|nr:hypothetical protein [Ignavibacteriales bacterium]